MKNLENYGVMQLNTHETTKISGGETGWYYLARAPRWAYDNLSPADPMTSEMSANYYSYRGM